MAPLIRKRLNLYPPCRGGSARQGRTPGACAAGAAARSAVALIQYGSTRQLGARQELANL